ncbi:MAG: tail fiber domain-containing protein [Betaproteobacteria bacterium]|nr:tail fiber domain-containing protein [Betaproteobacteria bacterium]
MRLWSGRLVKTHCNQALAGGRTMVFDTRHQTRPGIRCPAPHIRQDRGAAAFSLITAAVLLLFSAHAYADCPAAPLTSPDDLVISFRTGEGGPQASPGALLASTQKDGMLVYDGATKSLKLCNGTSWITLQSASGAGAAAGSVAGAVQFRGAGGNLAADDTNFVWDDTNNRLGIGTATPNGRLTISTGATANDFTTISSSGSISSSTNAGGTKWLLATNNGNGTASINVASDSFFGFNSQANMNGGGRDTGIFREAAGVISLYGVTGNHSKTSLATLYTGLTGIGTTTPHASALLDITSTTKGFLPPRMTTVQAAAIASPADGLMVYDTDTGTLKLRANGAWVSLMAGAGSEADPQVGTLTATKWCAANAGGTAIECTADAPTTGAAGSLPGAIQFRGETAVFAADDANLIWDDTTNRLLIGSTAFYATDGSITPRVQVHGTSATNGSLSLTAWLTNAASPGSLILGRSRGTTVGTNALVADGDTLGGVFFNGDDGTGFKRAAWIDAQVDGTPSANDMPGRLRFLTTADGAASSTERMRITSAGNVGIATPSPTSTLHLGASSTVQIDTPGTSAAGSSISIGSPQTSPGISIRRGDGSGNEQRTWQLRVEADSSFLIQEKNVGLSTGNSRLTVAAGGNVGIGTVTPGKKLVVSADAGTGSATFGGGVNLLKLEGNAANFSEPGVEFTEQSNAPIASVAAKNRGGGAGDLVFSTRLIGSNSLSERVRIRDDGNVGIGTTSPISSLQVNGAATFGNGGASAGSPANIQFSYPGSPISNRLTYGTDGTGWQFRIGKNQGGTVTDQLTLQDSGNVGIGTTTPTERLMVAGNIGTTRASTDYNVLTMTNTGGVQLHLNANANAEGNLRTVSNHPLSFSTNNIQRMLIDTSGRVGIGTLTPAVVIHATGQANAAPATSGSAQTGAAIRAGSGNSGNVLDIGINNTGSTYAWLQSTSSTNLATNYPLVLNPNGANVGVGTASPSSGLHVVSTNGGATSNWYDPNNYAATIHQNINGVKRYGLLVSNRWRSSESFVFAVDGRFTNGAGTVAEDFHYPYLIVRGDGNVGIGTSSPGTNLHVSGNANTEVGMRITNESNTVGAYAILRLYNNSSNAVVLFYNSSSRTVDGGANGAMLRNDGGNLTLAAAGSVICGGTCTGFSDARLKKQVAPLPAESGLAAILRLNPISFNWIDPKQPDTSQFGFIAQDVAKVLPDLVSNSGNTSARTPDGTLTLNYIGLLAPLVKSVQELKEANDNLVTENTTLRQRLEAVERRLDKLALP